MNYRVRPTTDLVRFSNHPHKGASVSRLRLIRNVQADAAQALAIAIDGLFWDIPNYPHLWVALHKIRLNFQELGN